MDPLSLLTSIFDIYSQITNILELVETNKKQCGRLAERIGIITNSLRGIDVVKSSDQFKKALEHLYNCLNDCLNFMSEFTKSKWYKKVFNRSSHQEQFKDLNEKLERSMQQLDLGLNVQQVMNREQDLMDQKNDMETLQNMQAEILRLNMCELSMVQGIKDNAEEAKKIQAQQHESIVQQLQMLFQLVQPTKQSQTDVEKNAQEPREDIDYHIVVPYYEIMFDSVIGKGSFGTIYLGRLGEQIVAIKTLEGNITPEDRQQFIREVKIMSRLRNENITQFYGASIETGRLCLLMEHMSQGSLFHALHDTEKKKQLTPELQHRIAIEIAQGLSYLHTCRVTHCDLKSANVLLNADYRAKLTDFGLSKICTQSIISINETSSAIQWMAPELFSRSGANRFNEKTDIYSYGTILWELVTGLYPFKNYQGNLVTHIMAGNREMIPHDVPEIYKNIITRSWQTDPQMRPTLSEILQLLRSYTPRPKTSPVEELCHLATEHEKRKEYKEAFLLYSQTAAKGHTTSQTRLGTFFLEGKGGIPRDKKQAYENFLTASQGGHKRAQYNLGMMLEYGDGVKKDLNQALHWYQEAQKNGNPDAQKRIDRVTQKLAEQAKHIPQP